LYILWEQLLLYFIGGGPRRAWAVFETIVSVADGVNALSEMKDNPIMTNDNVEVIYGEQAARNWLQLPG